MEEISIGVRFQPLGDITSNSEAKIFNKHWVLVFSGKELAFRIEASAGPGDEPAILMEINPCPRSYHAFRLGAFHGKWEDLRKILQVHPQRNTPYSPSYNNCQHFVAIYLLFLEAFADHEQGRYFSIDQGDRYSKIKETLNFSGEQVWNKENFAMAIINVLPITTAGAATGVAAIGAEATILATVPASGLMGWLGATTTATVPAAYAGVAAACFPIALGCTGLAAGAYIRSKMKQSEWKRKMVFDNPLTFGYLLEHYPALKFSERTIQLEATDGSLLNSGTPMASAGMAGSVIAATYFANRRASRDSNASASVLFHLAGKFIL